MRQGQVRGSFPKVWAATALGDFGDGILLVGFPLLAVELTRSPLLVSFVSVLATMPWLLVALYAGAIADRFDRRRIIISAAWLRAGVLALLGFAAATDLVGLGVVYVAVLILGTAEVFADTTAQSILPMVVEREWLGAANGRVIAAQRVANDFLGGPVAGVLVSVGAVAFFVAPASLYALAGLLMLSLGGRYRVERPSRVTLRADIREAVGFLRRHTVLRTLALLAGLLNFGSAAYLAMFVLWAVGDGSAMELAPQTYGALFAALAAGGVAGALLVEPVTKALGEIRVLLWAVAVSSLLMLLPVFLPSAEVAFPAFVMVGFGATLTNVAIVSVRQRLIPGDLLGRVNATYRLIGMGTMPFGAAFGGLLADVTDLVTVFVVAVSLSVGAVLYASRHVSAASVAAAEAAATATEGGEG
jgi:MFS family permease